jgi:hypothetical protein
MAEIDEIVAAMAEPNGTAPPVEWVAREMERHHPLLLPPDFPRAEADMLIELTSAGIRIAIRRRLGLLDEEGAEQEETKSSEELRAQAEALDAHARELEEYGHRAGADC